MPSNYKKKKKRYSRHRRLIEETQAACYDWLQECLNGHKGISTIDLPVAERGLHNAVMRYWLLLREYRHEPQLNGDWNTQELTDAPLTIGEHSITTLEDCRRLLFATTPQHTVNRDPVEGSSTTTAEEPAVLSMDQAADVLMALDDVKHELGFKAKPELKVADPEENLI